MDVTLRSVLDGIECSVSAVVVLRSGSTLVLRDWTDPDEDDLDLGDGPVRAALRSGIVTKIMSARKMTPWSLYRDRCARRGVLSVAAFPIAGRHGEPVGVMNVRSADYYGFSAADIRFGRTVADHLAAGLAS